MMKMTTKHESRWPWSRICVHGHFAWAFLLWSVSAPLCCGQEVDASDSNNIFRIGFSSAIFVDLNESDVRAALKVWTETVAKEIDIPTDPAPLMLEDVAALDAALRSGRVVSAAMTSAEYLAMSADLQTGTIILPVSGGCMTEEYLLLVHRDSSVRQIKDLAGRSLVRLDNSRASLVPVWLEVLLAQDGLRFGEACFSAVTRTLKVSQAVLQVFFRKVDACLVTRAGFETSNELNPQIGEELRVLVASPKFVPQLYCFRPDYPPALHRKAVDEISKMHESQQGRQIFTVFKIDQLIEQPTSCLDNVRELLATHRRLCGEMNSGKTSKLVLMSSEGERKGQR